MPPPKVRAMGWLVLPCRLALAGLFLLAAWMKLKDPQNFAFSIAAFKIIPEEGDYLAILATFVIPWLELMAGLLLLVGLWTRAAAAVLCLLLIAFMGGIASVMVRKMDVTCGCFGKFEYPCTGPLGMCQLVRDIIMLGMGLAVVTWGPGPVAIDRESNR